MLIAHICIGDTSVSLYSVERTTEDDYTETYELHFLDLPSGERRLVSFDGENKAMLSLAAWIACDELQLGALEPYAQHLRDTIGRCSDKFMS